MQLPADTILLYLRVNSFMTCKNLTSATYFNLGAKNKLPFINGTLHVPDTDDLN